MGRLIQSANQPLQDFLVYYPTGTQAGRAVMLRGNGDGSTVLSHIPGTVVDMMPGTFWDETTRDPLRLANAGHTAANAYPDLLGIVGDDTTGYYLTHHAAGIAATYDTVTSLPQQTTPTGGLDWNTWTLSGAITATGTTLFLWQQSTGKLYA